MTGGTEPLDILFDYATSDGTATAGVDYVATSGTGTLSSGASFASIPVPIIGDTLDEANETVILTVTNLRYA